MELFGAADQFVAVHLRHEEVAEEEVERTGKRTGDGFEGVQRAGKGDHAIAPGFKEEGSD